jgi:hypothetical protein
VRTILATPPIPKTTPDDVWDAFGWCASDTLAWAAPALLLSERPLGADNPPGMVFVMKRETSFLPREIARLHVPWLAEEDAWALAPYAIDDATDELYAHRARPRDELYLAADSLAGLFWGLHDWAHFHNHGPFTRRAWTEHHCDASALAWLWMNRAAVGLDTGQWSALRDAAESVALARFREEGETPPSCLYEAREIRGWRP